MQGSSVFIQAAFLKILLCHCAESLTKNVCLNYCHPHLCVFLPGGDEESAGMFAACGFRPALSVVSTPTFFKQLPPGRGIGYDATYHTTENEWIANLTTGWSDGLSRRLTNNGVVKRVKTGEYSASQWWCGSNFFYLFTARGATQEHKSNRREKTLNAALQKGKIVQECK